MSNISGHFTADNMYDSLADHDSIDVTIVDVILDIHKYLITKHKI